MEYNAPGKARISVRSLTLLAGVFFGFLYGIPARDQKARATQDNVAKPLQEFFHPLKGQPDDRFGFQLIGPDAIKHVHFEPEGVRLHLPAGHAGARPNSGFSTGIGLQGDFEITINFDILQEPEKAIPGTSGAKWHLMATKNTPPFDILGFSRHIMAKLGPRFTAWFNDHDPATRKNNQVFRAFRMQVRKGQMRLARTGPILSYYLAEDGNEAFVKLGDFPFGEDDLKSLRFSATTEGSEDEVNVRFTNLRVRAETLFNLPAVAPAAAQAPAPAPVPALADEESSLLPLLAMVLGVASLLVIVWFVRRRKRRKDTEAAGEVAQAETNLIPFACPDCSKSMKAPTSLAGKKIKCPGCQSIVLIPASNRRLNPVVPEGPATEVSK